MIKIKDIKSGAIVIYDSSHITKEYTIVDTSARVKLNGIWYNIITYKPNYSSEYTIFARTIEDFMNNFSIKTETNESNRN